MQPTESLWVVLLLTATVRISVPYIFASLGGFYSERAGIVNIALEGMLLNGALACVLGAYGLEQLGVPGNWAAWGGVACAGLAGVATGALHAWVTIRFKADQIVSGLGINLLAVGLTKFVLTEVFDSAANSARIQGLTVWKIPLLADWSLTRVLFCTPLVVLGGVAVFMTYRVFRHTVFGLRVHAVGENPEAAATLGINVDRVRWLAVMLGGALAGIGGAWLALDQHQFTSGMVNGRGFIALAALIFGKWTPHGAALGCFVFAFAEALQIHLQGQGSTIPTQFLQMLPYVVTMIALAGAIGRSQPPSALGRVAES